MGVYSFLNVNCAIAGAGGNLNLGSGAAVSEEGITIEHGADKNVMTIGADGRGQHSLVADSSTTITIRLLKTSPLNAGLMAMYNLQQASTALWGANVITCTDPVRGDTTIAQACAFKKVPTLTYAKEAGMNEWTFDSINTTTVLGSGGQ